MAVEMGKAADDNEESSSTKELSGQKVKAQGVTDKHKTWSVRMQFKLAGKSPIAPIAKGVR